MVVSRRVGFAYLVPHLLMVALIVSCLGAPLPSISVDPDTHFFVDELGRTRLFHGVNVVVKVPPFHPTLEEFNIVDSLCAEDMALLQELGFTAIRLGVMWPGVEIERAVYNQTYLSVMAGIVEDLANYGIYSIIDVHQDVLSPKFCGEGAPDYAVIPSKLAAAFPLPLLWDIPTDDSSQELPNMTVCQEHLFFDYYLSFEASTSFQSLYDNVDDIQTSFAAMWTEIAKTFNSSSAVLGYELLNEPWAGDIYQNPKLLEFGVADKDNLAPMYSVLHNAIRSVDTSHVILYEPCVINYGHVGFTQGPGGSSYDDRQALAYHLYCPFINSTTGNPENQAVCDAGYMEVAGDRLSDVERIGGGLYMTEFGDVDDANAGLEGIMAVMDTCDAAGPVSWNYWQYKDFGDITTQGGAGESFFFPNGSLMAAKVKALSRTYAQAIGGVPLGTSFDSQSGAFVLKFVYNASIAAPTLVYANKAFWYPNGVDVSIEPDGLFMQEWVQTNLLALSPVLSPTHDVVAEKTTARTSQHGNNNNNNNNKSMSGKPPKSVSSHHYRKSEEAAADTVVVTVSLSAL